MSAKIDSMQMRQYLTPLVQFIDEPQVLSLCNICMIDGSLMTSTDQYTSVDEFERVVWGKFN